LPAVSATDDILTVDRVQLLSGGLDSLCGAVVGLRDQAEIAFVGLRDSNNTVRRAQDKLAAAIGADASYFREEFLLREASARKNHGPRSRSLFYMAFGVLVATSLSARELWVPENGFTSINPALSPARGGTLTTRSTHPRTFHMVRQLLGDLGIGVVVTNPFEWRTKGELVASAGSDLIGPRWLDATSASYSCGLGNTQLHGGNPNHNCGLCVACVVRRASFIAGGVDDPTDYAVDSLSGAKRSELISRRSKDLIALAAATTAGLSDEDILSGGMWPLGIDFDAVIDVVHRGLKELGGVRLPRP
jgi:hypothetical protein